MPVLGGVLRCPLVLPAWAGYGGPAVVASARLDLWPDPIGSRQGFDKAPRAYLLIYAAALEQMAGRSEREMLQQFRTRSVNHDSVAS